MNATTFIILAAAAAMAGTNWYLADKLFEARRTLTNLRNAAHLRNEKGQIVRYANASREVRAKAEQN
ncbi:MAG: hypothetical protein KG075_17155 [Alphaproteobacteria bacterium]|nr:hypothetical protein [Alphaproteobacteria bacterium]